MKQLFTTIFTILSAFAFGQTNHAVSALSMSWDPFDLTIDQGDSVTWINFNQGMHNLNGTTATYPDNPESFGIAPITSNWTYGYRFNTPGVYNYRCDQHSGMLGKLTVLAPADINENEERLIKYGPNPASSKVTIQAPTSCDNAIVYSLLGEIVLKQDLKKSMEVDISALQKGTYFIVVTDAEHQLFREQLIKE